ncbi:acetylornithine deacetylase [Pseudobowmanella zhangzhouensis]|uniref:acetylornithine deacetylase n=1 Tax=Pseudobowmanella zhangzhouensis TaxID=1537679 RepID=UPI00360DEF23
MVHKKFTQWYQDIIAIPSISAFDAHLDQSNLAIIEYLAERFQQLGFHIDIQPVPGTRHKFNMLATVGSGEGGLLLAGHSDTVPFDEGRWNSDPFALKQVEQRFYGLGTCDMKGFFAFILAALEEMPLHKLRKPLYILATADEETSMVSARFFASQQKVKPQMAIIGEPTELKPIYKHKGHMAHRIDIVGQAGHSSDPARGVNAMEILHDALGQLLQVKDQLRQRKDDSFSVPECTLNLGHVHGGDGENRICGHCHMTFDVRPLPGMQDDEVVALLDEALAPVQQKWPNRLTRDFLYPSAPAFGCNNEYQIIELAERLTGFSAEPANYATEAPFINALGCDTLVLGPGSIKQAHQPDEFIDLHYVDPTVNLLRGFIQQICH